MPRTSAPLLATAPQVYDGLRAGAVPVYYGTKDVRRYVPRNSVIEVRDRNTTDLVREIRRAATEPARYAELQAWRQSPFVPEALKGISGSSHCRVCEAVAALRNLTSTQLQDRRRRRRGLPA